MKIKYIVIICLSVLSIIVLSLFNPSQANVNAGAKTLFQTSTFNALLTGVYGGKITFKEIKHHGNFGLGTVNDLDGEMIGLDGKFYQINSDGIVAQIPDSTKSPFAVVTFFQPEKSMNLPGKLNYGELQQVLDQKLSAKNYPYAIRIHGEFLYIKVRSIPKQTFPYLPLSEVIKKQSIFELKKIKGTLVGFRSPKYLQTLNVNGYHFHFLSDNHQIGGHLLAGDFADVQVDIQTLSDIKLDLPETNAFNQANLD